MDFLVGAAAVVCYLFVGLIVHKLAERANGEGCECVSTALIAWPLIIVFVLTVLILGGLEAMGEYFFDRK
jgi:hypothetical protein